jgi:hypothetical protein
MTVKVFIPSYKRLNSLHAVMYSLIKTYLPDSKYKYLCYIVNNFPNNSTKVDDLVDVFNKNNTIWRFKAIHREKTIPPVENWYSAISEFTNNGEIAFLQGDDDLFLPESIKYRVTTILENKADLLLTKQTGGVLFYDNTNDISVEHFNINNSDNISIVSNEIWSSIFIGNNTYYMSSVLRNAFNIATNWCNEQVWLSIDQRTLMYPIYIPIALNRLNANVIRSDKQCVIRSMNSDECRRALWGVPGWNSGFLHTAFIGVLNNNYLRNNSELDTVRIAANNYVALWYWTFFFDPRITKQVRKETFKRIGKPTFTYNTFIQSIIFFTKGVLSQFKFYNWLKDIVKPPKNMSDPIKFIDSLYEK